MKIFGKTTNASTLLMYTYQYREIMIPKIEPIILFLMFCAMKYGYTIIATYIVKKIFTNTRRRKEIKNERNSLNAGFARNNHYSCFNVFFEVISYYHSSLFYTTISLDVCEAFSTFFFNFTPLPLPENHFVSFFLRNTNKVESYNSDQQYSQPSQGN